MDGETIALNYLLVTHKMKRDSSYEYLEFQVPMMHYPLEEISE